MSVNLPSRHLYAPNGDAMLEICNYAGEPIAVVYSTPAGVRIDAINADQFFSVNVCDGSANGELYYVRVVRGHDRAFALAVGLDSCFRVRCWYREGVRRSGGHLPERRQNSS